MLQPVDGLGIQSEMEGRMGLWSRYKAIKSAEKKKSQSQDVPIDVSELDDDTLDAGDALEKEIAEELERVRKTHRRPD